MSTKLTLTIDESIIEKAKKYAKTKDKSLSKIIENYLKSILNEEPNDSDELSPLVKSLKGSFNAPIDFDYKKELIQSLTKKYL